MAEFRVTWVIDIEAGTAAKAALCALAIQRDIESTATCFTVENLKTGRKRDIDFEKDEQAFKRTMGAQL